MNRGMCRGRRFLKVSGMFLLCLMAVFCLRTEHVEAEESTYKLTVYYHEYHRRNMASSPGHLEDAISSMAKDALTSETELYVRKETEILFKIEGEDFVPQKLDLIIYRLDYEEGQREDVTGHYYQADKWRKSGEDTHYLSVLLDEETHLQFSLSYLTESADGSVLEAGDSSGQQACFTEGSYLSPEITVDETGPVIESVSPLTEADRQCQREDGMVPCYQDAAEYEILIAEENFNASYLQISYRTSSSQTRSGQISASDLSSWQSCYEDGVRKNSGILKVTEEGEYTCLIRVRDGSGLLSQEYLLHFIVDHTEPRISLSPTEDRNCLRLHYADVSLYANQPISCRIKAEDDGSGLAAICYRYEDADGILQEEEIRTDDVNSYSAEISLKADDFCGWITAWAVDGLGRKSQVIKSPVMLWESQKQADQSLKLELLLPQAIYKDEKNHILYYKKAPTITLQSQNLYAGIRRIRLSYRWKGQTQEQTEDYDQASEITYETEARLKLKAEDYTGSNRENPITLSAYSLDNAGYSKEKKTDYDLVIDHTAPSIQVSYSQEGEYFSANRSALITVTDANFDPEATVWKIRGDSSGYEIGSWQGEGRKHWCRVDFTGDGTYQIGLCASDYAQNRRTWQDPEAFIIDKTAPQIYLWMNQEDVSHKKYYAHAKKIYLCVKDDHINRDGVVLWNRGEGRLRLTEEKGSSLPLASFTGEGGWKVYSCKVSEEGVYRLHSSCQDLAGNRSQIVRMPEFVLDLTAPELDMERLSDGISYTNQVNPLIRIRDLNLDKDSCKLDLYYEDGSQACSLEKLLIREEEKGQVTLYWQDFPRGEKTDNRYRLRITGSDLAGNVWKGEDITFYVDRYGSRYQLDQATTELIRKYYLKEEQDITVKAYSLHPLHSSVTVIYNNEEYLTLGQEDYEESERILGGREDLSGIKGLPGRVGGWYETTYRISKRVFTEEGDYQIFLHSQEVDLRDHHILTESENNLWTESLQFAIDKTPPSVEIGGLEEEDYDAASRKYTITAWDKGRLKKVRIYVRKCGGYGAESVQIYTEKDFNDLHSIQAELQAYAGYQILGYEAWDYAGNKISSRENGSERRILLMEQSPLRVCYRYPIACGLILLLGCMLFLFFFLTRSRFFGIVKNKNRKECKGEDISGRGRG